MSYCKRRSILAQQRHLSFYAFAKKLGRLYACPTWLCFCYEIAAEISLSGCGALRCERDNVAAGPTDSASGRATTTGDASKDVRNRRIRLVPSNNLEHKIQVL